MYSETGLRFIAAWPHCDLLNAATAEDIAISLAFLHISEVLVITAESGEAENVCRKLLPGCQ